MTRALTMTEAAKALTEIDGQERTPRTIIEWICKGRRGVNLRGWMDGGRWPLAHDVGRIADVSPRGH